MNLCEALNIASALVPCTRLRELVDPEHPDYDAGYIPVVMHLAEHGELPRAAKPRLSIDELARRKRAGAGHR